MSVAPPAPPTDPALLDRRLRELLILPDDDRWDDARVAWNLAVDQRPAAVAQPASAEDVVAVVSYAREHGLRVAAQGTGHNASAIDSLDRTILVKTHRMHAVEIDPVARIARVEAGAVWEDVTTAADRHDLAALSGSSPDVGVVGYTLGGGCSWLARKYGLSANNVRAIEIVTADGRLVRTDAGNEPELFWALRGGGGSFGVVTAIDIELLPISEVFAGALFWSWDRAAEVLHTWREWTATVPDEVTSVGRIMSLPDLPLVPEPLRGRSFVVVEVIVTGIVDEGPALVEPLRALGPEIDTFATVRPVDLTGLHMDPPQPVPVMSGGHRLLGTLPAAAIDRILAVAGPGADSPLASVEIRHIGGALARPGEGHGALARLDGEYMTFSGGLVLDAEQAAAVARRNGAVAAAVDEWATGQYLNFVEHATDPAGFYPADVYARLRAAKSTYDPTDMFLSNHPIPTLAQVSPPVR
jgi:FAD binding domain/Berberine and berberine like